MAVQTLVSIANNPPANTAVWGPSVFAFRRIGTITSWSVQVQAWSLTNGGGSLVVCGNLKAINHDWTTGADLNQFNGNFNTVTATSGQGALGDALAGQGVWSISGNPGSLVITLTYDDAWGMLIPLVKRSGVWSIDVANTGGVRRTGVWAGGTRGRVRRSGAWRG